jgi:hypothetical protein
MMAIRRTPTMTDEQARAAKRAELEAELAKVDAASAAAEKERQRAAQAEQRAAALAAHERHQRMAATTRVTNLAAELAKINAAFDHADPGARAEFVNALKRLLAAAS